MEVVPRLGYYRKIEEQWLLDTEWQRMKLQKVKILPENMNTPIILIGSRRQLRANNIHLL